MSFEWLFGEGGRKEKRKGEKEEGGNLQEPLFSLGFVIAGRRKEGATSMREGKKKSQCEKRRSLFRISVAATQPAS